MNVYSDTNIGLKRHENQDRVRIYSFNENAKFAVICDGMGGENAGSEASEKAIEVVYDRITKVYKSYYDNNMVRNLLISAVKTANSVVYDLSVSSVSMQGMGTTCVAVLRDNSRAFVVNVGDSRAYLINNSIRQITKDHTVVMKMYENGEISKDEIKNHPQRNYITRAVGVSNTVDPDIFEFSINDDSVLMICSDGLSSCCEDEDILNEVKNSKETEIAHNLIKLALNNGGNDNISVAIIK